MSLETRLSTEEELLDKALSNGEITQEEYNEELRELHRDFNEAFREQELEDLRDRAENW